MVFVLMGNIYIWFRVAMCFRHARAPFPTGWGSVAHKPLPGRGGGRKKRHETTRAGTRHADDHYLTPLSTSVTNISTSLLYSCFCAHFILAKHLHWLSPHSFTDLFNITNMRGKVAKFCIFKTVYRLGEDITGTFTLSEGDIPCLQVQITPKPLFFFPLASRMFFVQGTVSVCCMWSQYSVSLQSEEEVHEQYQRRPAQAVSVTSHGRHLESCLHTASSHFSLPVPLNVTPGFSTDIGQITFLFSLLVINSFM